MGAIGAFGLLMLNMIFILVTSASLLLSMDNYFKWVMEEDKERNKIHKMKTFNFFMCFITFMAVIVAAEYFIPKLLT